MESILYESAYVLSTLFKLYIISKFMNIFLGAATKEKSIIAVAYIFQLVACAVQYAYMPYVLLNMSVGVITLFIITLCYDGKVAKKITAVVLIYVCLLVSEVVIAGVLELAGIHVSESRHNGDVFSYIGISIIFWIIYEMVRAFKNINAETVLPKTVDVIIVVLSIIIFLMETVIFSQKDIMDSVKVISVIFMLTVLFLIIYLYDFISKYYVGKIQSEILEREKNYYLKQVELLEQNNTSIRNFRHDMKNHLYAIASMISDDNEEAKKYLTNMTEKFEKNEIYSSTGNIALDSVINYKLGKASNQSIQINSNITIPSHIQEGVEDLVTIIGNLLDNAIEASENVVEDRYIGMKIKYKRAKQDIDSDTNVEEVVDKEISKQCLYKAACDEGFEISDDEAKKIAKEQRASVKDSDEYKQVKEFIRGAEMTEDEYWDAMIIQYKMSETINNYLSYIESKELKDYENLDAESYQKKVLEIDEKIRQKAVKKYRKSIVK